MPSTILVVLLATFSVPAVASAQSAPLVVVDDRGGTSALPYYRRLNLQPRSPGAAHPPFAIPAVQVNPASDLDMLPVRSPKLAPGVVARRVIEAPGLQPFFLIGDDGTSRSWLSRNAASLHEHGAVGLVVNVETATGLAELRALAPGLPLAPMAADDLADRLGVRHYPVLITSTGIEQ
ncbi:integrating conjugative element protein [Pseudomonas aeruginosa]|uniref:integrating conjugative element protein n=1 Tax=Pseudomonas aeruginosa TaxID=287 RepID=UPI00068EB02C|nr:integrating conjugative element protein [Pseudomonas aeruginosa]WCV81036.1 integrating conjugative element protein [Pseudomonas aeruginosa]HBO0859759.1 integrating conjugative element protein [Pseudomonas aeruginosa]HCE6879311.1 integrating conjugative element protein [Pseudomonas aeruginosa]HDR2971117.1 integrating conjugative element protein [Pseudomonas aeruginosa]